MRTERPEALSLFRRWLEESSLLYCELTFRAAAVAFEGKITSLSDELVTLRSDDGRSKIRVALAARGKNRETCDLENVLSVYTAWQWEPGKSGSGRRICGSSVARSWVRPGTAFTID